MTWRTSSRCRRSDWEGESSPASARGQRAPASCSSAKDLRQPGRRPVWGAPRHVSDSNLHRQRDPTCHAARPTGTWSTCRQLAPCNVRSSRRPRSLRTGRGPRRESPPAEPGRRNRDRCGAQPDLWGRDGLLGGPTRYSNPPPTRPGQAGMFPSAPEPSSCRRSDPGPTPRAVLRTELKLAG